MDIQGFRFTQQTVHHITSSQQFRTQWEIHIYGRHPSSELAFTSRRPTDTREEAGLLTISHK